MSQSNPGPAGAGPVSFTSKFLWGAATSSHQIEGDNIHNDWWHWEQQGRCEGGARSGKATDHWHHYKSDLKLAADLGLNSYRFSVEWSRFEPEEGKWDQTAIDWYRDLILECEKNNLLPMLTLHHFTSPQWFADQGGFVNQNSPQKFLRFVDKVVSELGSRVPLWCTFNEPMVMIVGGYFGQFMPPGEYSPRNASKACHNVLRAHALSYDLIHAKITKREGPWKDHPLMVGFAHNMISFRPDRKWHPLEILMTKILKRFYNRAWLDGTTGLRQYFGVRGLIPYAPQVAEALGRRTTDFIGVNYYTKAYVQWWPRAPAQQERAPQVPVGIVFARRKELMSDLDWAIYPKGLGKMLRKAALYGLPIYITENGIADREDKYRAQYIENHLEEVAKAVRGGMDIRGYYHWSLLDNFEWIKGFGPRFGLYKVDYETLERLPNKSTEVLSTWIKKQQNLGF